MLAEDAFEARFTSWGKRRRRTALLVESGPAELGQFGSDEATVAGEEWTLERGDEGAAITREDGEVMRLVGRLGRDKELVAELPAGRFTLVNEARGDWVVVDAEGAKVAQFTGTGGGVRSAVLELATSPVGAPSPGAEGPATAEAAAGARDAADPAVESPATVALTDADVAALSWFARLILEARLERSSTVLIVVLVAATILALLTFLL